MRTASERGPFYFKGLMDQGDEIKSFSYFKKKNSKRLSYFQINKLPFEQEKSLLTGSGWGQVRKESRVPWAPLFIPCSPDNSLCCFGEPSVLLLGPCQGMTSAHRMSALPRTRRLHWEREPLKSLRVEFQARKFP